MFSRIKRSIKKHFMTVHQKLLPFKCDICIRGFSEKRLLLKHQLSHLENNNLKESEKAAQKSLQSQVKVFSDISIGKLFCETTPGNFFL